MYSHSQAMLCFCGNKVWKWLTDTEWRQKITWKKNRNCEYALKRQSFDKCPSAEELTPLCAKCEPLCNRIIFMQTIFFLSRFIFIVFNELLILWIFDAANGRCNVDSFFLFWQQQLQPNRKFSGNLMRYNNFSTNVRKPRRMVVGYWCCFYACLSFSCHRFKSTISILNIETYCVHRNKFEIANRCTRCRGTSPSTCVHTP